MEKRALGQSGIRTAPLCLGGNVFGWTLDEAGSFRVLDEFVGAGFDFIDTADVYSTWVPGHVGGESETIIGKWFQKRGNRAKVVLATKVGWLMPPDHQGLSRANVIRAVEDSLRRLQTDYIDLYQAHIDDADTALEETLGAFGDLLRQGKVRAIGASNYSAARLTQALDLAAAGGLPRYDSLQPLYNLYDRSEFEDQLAPLCTQRGVGAITYFSLASGFLSGKYRSQQDLAGRARGQRVEKYLNARGMAILAALDEVAAAHASTPAGVALAWLMARPGVVAPIASATSSAQLQALIAAASLKLDPDSIRRLDQASS
ncbi:MAG TPA: aldo/keto reductase [Steroidobacteraceae bacterium]|nr:aldo/keto reductase [Steroidobacteraceae bacterium]